VDDSGHPDGATQGQNGNGGGHYPGQQGGRARLNGWAAVDDVWSSAGAALEPALDPIAPGWRGVERPSGTANGSVAQVRPASDQPASPPPRPADASYGRDDYLDPDSLRVPSSAPPYPYEGDLEDAQLVDGWPPEPAPIPTERPTEPSGPDERGLAAVGDQSLARHSMEEPTPAGGLPTLCPPGAQPGGGMPANGGPSGWRDSAQSAGQPSALDRGNPPYQSRANYDRRFESLGYGAQPVSPAPRIAPATPPAAALAPAPPVARSAAPPAAPPGPQSPPTFAGPVSAPPTGYARALPATAARPDSAPAPAPVSGPPRPTSAPPRASLSPSPAVAPVSPAPVSPAAGFAERPTRLQRAHQREALESGYAGAPSPAAPEPTVPPVPPGYQPAPAIREAPALVQHRYEPVRPRHAPYDTVGPVSAPPAVPIATPIMGAADEAESLPQRVPAPPDVPNFSAPDATEPPAETTEIARIANRLRQKDVFGEQHERPAGFDVPAVLAAVRGVPGVRDAHLRTNEAGAHTLRLDLADGADPAAVSRQVARLLGERMGLAAAPQSGAPPVADRPSPPAGVVPQLAGGPSPVAGRAPVDRAAAERPAEAGTDTFRESRWRQPASSRVTEPRPAPRVEPRVEQRAEPRVEPRAEPRPEPSIGGYDPITGYASVGQQASAGQAPPRPLNPGRGPGPRVVIDHVQVSTFGLDATVEVRMAADGKHTVGLASGPAVDGYVLRLCAVAAAVAIDDLLRGAEQAGDRGAAAATSGGGRCFVEHAAVVPFGSCEVAVVVVLLVCGGWVEQLAGSARVSGDPRQAVVRATLAAVNRRLAGLLS
jgi:hypothetical protein